jgi:hypothetical protein
MFFTFPEDARWNAERQAVEIGKYHGVVRVPRRVFQRLLPERCAEAYYLQGPASRPSPSGSCAGAS